MGKLNYINRKSDGVKLGQIVAKDLRKRIKCPDGPATGDATSRAEHHRDTTPLEIVLEGKVLTDEGAEAMAAGLEDCLCNHDGSIHLQALNISRNELTVRGISALSKSLAAACDDLEELDISGNKVSVTTDKEAEDWATFLESMRSCKHLKKLNMSGNRFCGTRPWEIFARVFTKQFRRTIKDWSLTEDGLEVLEELEREGVESGIQALALRSPPSSPTTPLSPRSDVSRPMNACGLPSISHIFVNDTQLTDSGALFLSYAFEQHKWIQSKLHERSSTVPGPSTASNCAFTILPNENLGAVGQKLIRLAELDGKDPSRPATVEKENVAGSARRDSSSEGSRRTSGSDPPSRKVSSSSPSVESHSRTASHQHLSIADELESTRKKLQRTIIENEGAHSVELWSTALKLLPYVRVLLDESQPRPSLTSGLTLPPHQTGTYEFRAAVGNATTTSAQLADSSGSKGRRRGSFSWHLSTTPSPWKPEQSYHVPAIKASIGAADAIPKKIGGLVEKAWEVVLAMHVDNKGLLTLRQQENIVNWGKSRGTLMREMECLGKPKSVQIWKVLEATRCLTYDTKV